MPAPGYRPGRRPESALLRTLFDPLFKDAQREVDLALRVALMIEHRRPQAEIAERLGISHGEVRAATKRVEHIRERLEREAQGAPTE